MMRVAIHWACGRIEHEHKCDPQAPILALEFPKHGLARIQWEGPWTKPGANPKWAYRQTHWVASWRQDGETLADKILAAIDPVIFDVNGGLMLFEQWEQQIVPAIVANIPRADGGWHLTHSWEIAP